MTEQAFIQVQQGISRYFFLLDELTDAAALAACLTDDAIWECYDDGDDQPILRFQSRDDIAQVLAMASLQTAGARIKHHLTGVVIESVTDDRIAARAKVLVTIQPPGANE